MVVLIAGASHTGKTALAQSLLEQKGYPYLSIDLLKMGLIRSGQTNLSPEDDAELTEYLWPIVREMIKTAIENKQNLIVDHHFDEIKAFANVIEHRGDDSWCTKARLQEENQHNLAMCKKYGLDYSLIEDSYQVTFFL